MAAGTNHQPLTPGEAGAAPYSGMGSAGRLRDAGWAPAYPVQEAGRRGAETRVLYRWNTPAEGPTGGLLFQSLDGNPRHGILALFLSGRHALHEAIEILERQGCWLVMPDRVRASKLAAGAFEGRGFVAPVSSIAGTPDRRFVFFNTLQERGMVALVERRKEGGDAAT